MQEIFVKSLRKQNVLFLDMLIDVGLDIGSLSRRVLYELYEKVLAFLSIAWFLFVFDIETAYSTNTVIQNDNFHKNSEKI